MNRATCKHWWRKESREARRTTRRAARHADRAALRAIANGADPDAALFTRDLGTEGHLTH